MSAQPSVVEIHGTEYTLIAKRLRDFRNDHPNWSIETAILSDDERVVVETTIRTKSGRLIATGHAEEERGLGNINQTSCVENCETSSVGRALAFVSGEYAGAAIRSADEMANALSQQGEKAQWAANRAYMDAFEEHYESIRAIRGFLAEENFDAAKEAMQEIPNEAKLDLNRAWTKGGPFNPRETKQIKWWSNDFEKRRGDV